MKEAKLEIYIFQHRVEGNIEFTSPLEKQNPHHEWFQFSISDRF